MKKYLFSLPLLCAALQLCAQTQTPASAPRQHPSRASASGQQHPSRTSASGPQHLSRWSIAFTAGAAIPVGAFAGIHNEASSGGSVSVGPTAEIAGMYRIRHWLSAALVVNGQLNHGNGIPASLSDLRIYRTGEYHQGALANDWQLTRVLAGGVFSLPLCKHDRVLLQLRALAGTQKTRTPAFAYVDPRIEVAQGYSNVLHYSAQTLGQAFSYQLDAGIRWQITSRWAFLANSGYNGCQPSRYPSINPGGPPGPMIIYVKHKLPTGTIAIRTGVELTL